MVITETPKAAFELTNIGLLVIPNKNYILTIRYELTKFIQAYPIQDTFSLFSTLRHSRKNSL